jgi:hypothetical protein
MYYRVMGKGVGKGGKKAAHLYKAIITLIFSNCSLLVLLLINKVSCIIVGNEFIGKLSCIRNKTTTPI